MTTMKIIGYCFSPLEQFSNISESVYVKTIANDYQEISLWDRFVLALDADFQIAHNSFFLILILGVFVILLNKEIIKISLWANVKAFVSMWKADFSILFLLFFFILFTGSFIFFWFNDFFGMYIESDYMRLITGKTYIIWKETMQTTVNFSIVWDETLITFLAGFLLLSGSEEEDDEDFILEKEESTFIEDVVAPLFVANFGKNVEDNGALFAQVCAIFGFVLFCNLIGMLPYSDTATSSLFLTFWVALTIFGSLLYKMITRNGVNYFFNLFLPAGSPLPLMFLLVPLEFFSYVFRIVSVSVRLFANMMAGHTLLKVIVGFSWTMLLLGDVFLLLNIFPIAILFVLTFLELGVAIVQAYVFVILTCIYIKDIFIAH